MSTSVKRARTEDPQEDAAHAPRQLNPLESVFPAVRVVRINNLERLPLMGSSLGTLASLSRATFIHSAELQRYPSFLPTGMSGVFKDNIYSGFVYEGKKLNDESSMVLRAGAWGDSAGKGMVLLGDRGALGLVRYGFGMDGGLFLYGGVRISAVMAERFSAFYDAALDFVRHKGRVDMHTVAFAGAVWGVSKLPVTVKGDVLVPLVTALRDGGELVSLSNLSKTGNPILQSVALHAATLVASDTNFLDAIQLANAFDGTDSVAQFLSQIPSVAMPFALPGQRRQLVTENGEKAVPKKLSDLGDGEMVVLADSRPGPNQIKLFRPDSLVISAPKLFELIGDSKKQATKKDLGVQTVPASVFKALAKLMVDKMPVVGPQGQAAGAHSAGEVTGEGMEEGEDIFAAESF